jgi:hypothetical protein
MSEASPAQGLPEDALPALACVLDLLIPPSADGRFPGAGELGLAGYVDGLVRQRPELLPLLAEGLAALEAGGPQGQPGYAALPPEARLARLHGLESSLPGFVPTLCFLAYTGYYREPRVLAALGLEARPPFPKGYEMGEADFSLLEPVRRRGKLYREC